MKKIWFAVLVIVGMNFPAVSVIARQQTRFENRAFERKIDSLLALMTMEEKLGQLNQLPGHWDNQKKRSVLTPEQRMMVEKGQVGSFLNVLGAGVTREYQSVAVERSRLRIPMIFGFDVIHGFRTVFPIPLAEASSWDPVSVERSARIAAVEATAMGLHWTFAPMVDIARDPRWGRIAEGSGEDPYLGSVLAAARVRGFQGSSFADPTTLVACAKHFAAYGGAEGGRDYNVVDISERTLREVYLPPFKAAVDAGAGTLMSAFNEIAGIPSSANRHLLTSILRSEWGFKGFVVSDWTAIEELKQHGIAGTSAEAARKAIEAGVDMDMVSELFVKELPTLAAKGTIAESVIDQAVRRILRVKFALGLFENPYRNCSLDRERLDVMKKEHVEFARSFAARSLVLLKNDGNILPLRKDIRTLAVIGPLSDSRVDPLGPWHGIGRSEDVVSILDGIRKAVSTSTRVLTAKGCDSTFTDTSGFAEAVRIGAAADAIIMVVGEHSDMSGEAASRSDLGLPGVQAELVKRIQSIGKPLVLVLMNGRPLTIPWEARHVPAIVEAWFPGIQAGNAVADVLFGDVNPSGKLPVSFPRSMGQIPVHYDYKNTGRPPSELKYTSKYLDVSNSPLYPFGYGLSYTTFSYSKLSVDKRTMSVGDSLIVSVQVTNTGKRKGDEVVQLYLRDLVASVTRPVMQLRGLRRITLEPGETKLVQFMIKQDDLSFYDENIKWICEPGVFKIFVGTNCEDVLEAEFEVR